MLPPVYIWNIKSQQVVVLDTLEFLSSLHIFRCHFRLHRWVSYPWSITLSRFCRALFLSSTPHFAELKVYFYIQCHQGTKTFFFCGTNLKASTVEDLLRNPNCLGVRHMISIWPTNYLLFMVNILCLKWWICSVVNGNTVCTFASNKCLSAFSVKKESKPHEYNIKKTKKILQFRTNDCFFIVNISWPIPISSYKNITNHQVWTNSPLGELDLKKSLTQ